MTLFSSTRLAAEHGELLRAIAPTLTRSLRIARVRGAEPQQGGPGVLLLDGRAPLAAQRLTAPRPGRVSCA
jgi:hypothetical protein